MEYYKILMNKQKMQLEDEKLKSKANATRIDTLENELKLAEEKIGHNRYNLNTYKKTLSEKELEIKNKNEKLVNMEKFFNDKENLDKKIHDQQKQIVNLKIEIE